MSNVEGSANQPRTVETGDDRPCLRLDIKSLLDRQADGEVVSAEVLDMSTPGAVNRRTGIRSSGRMAVCGRCALRAVLYVGGEQPEWRVLPLPLRSNFENCPTLEKPEAPAEPNGGINDN